MADHRRRDSRGAHRRATGRRGGRYPGETPYVDPGDALLTRWRTNTAATGMAYLRSPAVHHLDTHSDSLNRFAGGRRQRRRPKLFAPPYRRPGLALFNAHCDRVVEAHGLADLHLQDRAERCAVDGRGIGVQCSSGREVQARNVVLAIGASEQPAWPDWAPRNDPRVRHLFEPGFDGWATPHGTIAVVGGGISASQVALRLAKEGRRVASSHVTLCASTSSTVTLAGWGRSSCRASARNGTTTGAGL